MSQIENISKADVAAWLESAEKTAPRCACGREDKAAACEAWTPSIDARGRPASPPWDDPYEGCRGGNHHGVVPCRVMLSRVTEERRHGEVALRIAARAHLARTANVPEDLWGGIGVYRPVERKKTTALAAVEGFTTGILVLGGPTGVGKSLAAAVAMLRCKSPALGLGTSWGDNPPRFEIAASLRRADWFDDAVAARVLDAQFLVVDDLGAEQRDSAAGTWGARLDEIFSVRHGRHRPLIVTTNLREQDFLRLVGERAEDRIRDAGRYVACPGDSLRQRKATP